MSLPASGLVVLQHAKPGPVSINANSESQMIRFILSATKTRCDFNFRSMTPSATLYDVAEFDTPDENVPLWRMHNNRFGEFGHVENIHRHDHLLLGDVCFSDTHEGQEAYQRYESGEERCVSVGWKPPKPASRDYSQLLACWQLSTSEQIQQNPDEESVKKSGDWFLSPQAWTISEVSLVDTPANRMARPLSDWASVAAANMEAIRYREESTADAYRTIREPRVSIYINGDFFCFRAYLPERNKQLSGFISSESESTREAFTRLAERFGDLDCEWADFTAEQQQQFREITAEIPGATRQSVRHAIQDDKQWIGRLFDIQK